MPLAALAAALLAACSDVAGPGNESLQVQALSLAELGQRVGGDAAARVEITLRENGPVAGRVAVKTGDEMAGEEWVTGMVTGLTVEGDRGVLQLAFGVQVTFDGESELAGLRGDRLGFEQFVGGVTEALALGREPRIRAVRPPADAPQAPADPLFRASAIRLTDDPVRAMIALNVDRDNLAILDSPPPDAILTVLGLGVELRVSEGLTELILDRDERREVVFEGTVQAVRVDAGTFTLRTEARELVVRVVDDTRMALGDRRIESLAPVARALEDGLTVIARGEGLVREGADGILALVVRFRLDDGRPEVAFGGRVASLDVATGTMVLVEGPTVRIGERTSLKVNGQPVESLERIAAALETDLAVFAFGEGVIEGESDVIQAAFVRFEVDDGTTDQVEFAGRVASVNLDAGSFTLVEGPTIQVRDGTSILDGSALAGLGGVAEALAGGLFVVAEGCGTVVSEEPRVIAARVLTFRVGD